MEILRFESDLLQSNMYVVTENGHAIVVDPCRNISPADGLQVDYILLTHEHYDHTSGVNVWKEATGATVLCSTACAANIKSPRKSLARFFDVFCEMQTWINISKAPESDPDYCCQADEIFSDVFDFQWQNHSIKLMEMPGHSAGSMGILLDNQHFFSGDSLMEDNEIELRFPGGSAKLWQEIGQPRLNALPQGLQVWPGHFAPFILK